MAVRGDARQGGAGPASAGLVVAPAAGLCLTRLNALRPTGKARCPMVDGVASQAWRVVEVSIMREQTTKEFAETRVSINAAVLALLGTSPKRIYEAGGGSGTVLTSNLT